MVACQSGDLELIEYLLDNNANVNATTIKNETPLMMATKNAIRNEKLKESEEIRPQENPKDLQIDINSLQEACLNDLNIIKLLLKKGANINAKNSSGRSVIDFINSYPEASCPLLTLFFQISDN